MSKFTNKDEEAAFHRNATVDGRPLEPHEREAFFNRYLPPTPNSHSPSPARGDRSHLQQSSSKKQPRKTHLRALIMSQVHLLIYTLIHFFFSIYIRIRRMYHAVVNRFMSVMYYHHRTPELIAKDVKALDRVPDHLSVVLELRQDDGLEGLLEDVAEVAAWCCSAQIGMLSIYEKTGILKSYQQQTHRAITRNLHAYFGPPPARPTVSLRAPHMEAYSPPSTPLSPFPGPDPFHINVLLLSADDGRNTMVDLTKTLAEMSQRGKLRAEDVTADVIDIELRDGVMGEPDLLLLFGERVVLDGYPPWQVRLTEIFHVPDNTEGVGYQVFLAALHRYAKAQMRFGR
ncbi:di-trans,poly-cis-decaprenylcistransferas-like protein [Rhizodiscina lignyota]|uniref:ditrans,polycis-polyprenyl diphosphate synthase [(2E,6E)-farnesyldiphosphate specific] n=1 Tax=Rhizodiscina lignyota TaxID=1504668 RepID=A0A9P4IDP0_9PEZI|nr:di-trans,poly-cis-decaprenylcistransferas-like protein [Rhizodiscina lignyota]